jgi:hypothetical protein
MLLPPLIQRGQVFDDGILFRLVFQQIPLILCVLVADPANTALHNGSLVEDHIIRGPIPGGVAGMPHRFLH